MNQSRGRWFMGKYTEIVMTASLARFTITKAIDETFLLNIEDDSGTTLELEATYDQLDLITEAIDEALNEEVDAHDGVDADEADVTDDE